jgi:flavin-dependent dehydrogenase
MGALYHRTLAVLDPELADGLAAADSEVRLRAFPGLPGFIRQSVGEGWALVGDAGYFRDPLTAHGITDALREAEFLTRAVLSGTEALATYQSERDARVTGLLEVTNQVCAFEWDMDEVKALHMDLSREMNVGVDAIRAIDESAPEPAGNLAATAS